MDNLSNWISLAALVISVSAFLHTWTRSVTESRLDRAQARSDLLTRIVELKLEYEQEVNHLIYLADLAARNGMEDAIELMALAEKYREFVAKTQKHYDGLFNDKTCSKKELIEMGHHIDALRARVNTENSRIRERTRKIERAAVRDEE